MKASGKGNWRRQIKDGTARHRWLTPVIPATHEAEIRRIVV
jgi:hypothetical protein